MTVLYGASGTAQLLILSLVVLSLQPPFATVPLVRVVAYNGKMTGLRAPRSLTWACGVFVLNLKLLWDVANGALRSGAGCPIFFFTCMEIVLPFQSEWAGMIPCRAMPPDRRN